MESERVEALAQAGVLSFVSILTTVLLVVLARRAVDGRLARNQWAGIRTAATLRSDVGWAAGHRAALRLTPLFLVANAVTCGALFAAAFYVSALGVVRLIGIGVIVETIILVVYSAYAASKAANAAEAKTADPRR